MKTVLKITKLELEIVDGVVTHCDMQREERVITTEAEDHARLAARREVARPGTSKKMARK
jgi:hypothetical protein